MNTHLRTLTRCLAIGLLLVALIPACSRHDAAGGKKSNIDYWTCTMHPSVHAKDPGKCPICAMNLVPVLKRDTSGGKSAATKEETANTPAEKKSGDMEGPGMSRVADETGPDTPDACPVC